MNWITRTAMMAIVLSGGCIEIPSPPEADGANESAELQDPGPTLQPNNERNNQRSPELRPDDGDELDAQEPVVLPDNCDNHCECPAGYDCINKRCVLGEMPIYCCSNPDCPEDRECWSADGEAGTCLEPTD